ncbi:MAG: hypothetical protein WCV56_02030 [Candidatus Omnitrophota bacterium]
MKHDNAGVSLDSIRFLVQHPRLFIVPIVIMASIAFSYISAVPPVYECMAAISFDVPGGDIIGSEFFRQKENMLNNILLGDNIKRIIKEVWPEVSEEKDGERLNALVNRLRDPNKGIKINARRPRQTNATTIQFQHTDPEISYKVVSATIDVLKTISREKTESEIELGLAFLRNQLEFYRDKIKNIDEEISRIKMDLTRKYTELSREERMLVDDILSPGARGDTSMRRQAFAQQMIGYEEKSTDLNLQLLELEKRKEDLLRQLSGEDAAPLFTAGDLEKDHYLAQYRAAIVRNELAMSELFAQGFLPAHPQARRIQGEIDGLNLLKEKRIRDLTDPAAGRSVLEERIEEELRMVETQIETVKLQIDRIEEYKSSSEKQLSPGYAHLGEISSEISRLASLSGEREVNLKYLQEMRHQMEMGEVRARIEREEVGVKINVVEGPQLPLNPIPFQNAKVMLYWTILGIGAGITLAYLADSLDNSIKSSSELRVLLKIPVLASMDQVISWEEHRRRNFGRKVFVIALAVFVLMSGFIVTPVLRMLGVI